MDAYGLTEADQLPISEDCLFGYGYFVAMGATSLFQIPGSSSANTYRLQRLLRPRRPQRTRPLHRSRNDAGTSTYQSDKAQDEQLKKGGGTTVYAIGILKGAWRAKLNFSTYGRLRDRRGRPRLPPAARRNNQQPASTGLTFTASVWLR